MFFDIKGGRCHVKTWIGYLLWFCGLKNIILFLGLKMLFKPIPRFESGFHVISRNTIWINGRDHISRFVNKCLVTNRKSEKEVDHSSRSEMKVYILIPLSEQEVRSSVKDLKWRYMSIPISKKEAISSVKDVSKILNGGNYPFQDLKWRFISILRSNIMLHHQSKIWKGCYIISPTS